MRQQDIVETLPPHLRRFVAEQDSAQYSARDHAVWRFILHQLAQRLRDTAHPVYQDGLRRTGISLEHIPSIDEMNAALAGIGWGAVVVDGFIPPAIFMEFQARRILVIALAMRSYNHILYTPAPDIVHESAGHAPFLVDIDYAEFLERFGEVGMRAISSQADLDVFAAIRHLSIVKENSRATPDDIATAEARLEKALADNPNDSEAALLSRLHWWTVEYGLVGELDDYRIFGAGLLSSLGESVHCLDDARVEKRPLSVEAIAQPYDITREQPHLYVTKSCRHLTQVLDTYAATMAFARGGRDGLERARRAGSVCTAQFNSGLQVSGRIERVLCDAAGNPIYLQTGGPTQLACENHQLSGHGPNDHDAGFGSPIGTLKDLPDCPSSYSVDALKAAGIAPDTDCCLEFVSGITVRGHLTQIYREHHRNLLFHFVDCVVTNLDGQCLFGPGNYAMAVGSSIPSVFGGAADRSAFDLYADFVSEASPAACPSADEATLFARYAQVRRWRESGEAPANGLARLATELDALAPNDWLLRLELLELQPEATTVEHLRRRLAEIGNTASETAELIRYGLEWLDDKNPAGARPGPRRTESN